MIIIDPHRDDFVFEPVIYKLLKRKPLKKYEYLKDLNFKYFITYDSLSIPAKLDKFIPFFLKKKLVEIEHYLWKKYNNVNWERANKLENNNIFIFPHKKISALQNIFKNLNFHNFNNCFVHLSHYHLYHKQINNLCLNFSNINLCADVDISSSKYFKEKLFNYKKKIFLIPFQVRKSFFEYDVEVNTFQSYSIGIIGSYHEFPLESTLSDIKTYDGLKKTLHPIRYQLSKENISNLKHVNYKLSLYNRKGIFSSFTTFNNQKKYFSFDILKFYSISNFIICASEASGAIGIGLIEAMSLGRGVIISKDDFLALKLDHTDGVVVYNTYKELINIIKDKREISKNLFFKKNYDFSQAFRNENLIINAKRILND